MRYDPARVDLDDVVAPPYDVVDDGEWDRLAARSPYNVVHVDLARREPGNRYEAAGRRFEQWLEEEVLVSDPDPSFYVYRMGYRDEQGQPRQTSGLIGALELSPPGEGDVLPHERTMSKPKDDRLNLLRACRADISPVWGLSLAPGLSALAQPEGPPVARCTDGDGVHHRLWRVDRPAVLSAVREAVASAPVVIADGHHRYETSLAYREERRRARGGAPGDYDRLMAYLVELAPDQLSVRPVHRLLAGVGDPAALVEVLSTHFRPVSVDGGPDALPDALVARMVEAQGSALVLADRSWLLLPPTPKDGQEDLDVDRLDSALLALSPHQVDYHHDHREVVARVHAGVAQAAVLLRPPTVEQIAATARSGRRMPQKTTYFHPKPRTGMVFRRVLD